MHFTTLQEIYPENFKFCERSAKRQQLLQMMRKWQHLLILSKNSSSGVLIAAD